MRKHEAQLVIDTAAKRTLVNTRRHGKYLGLDLEGGFTLGVHLRMSGQLRVQHGDEPVALHTHARLLMDDGSELRFIDPRTFGELWICDADEPLAAALGPDAFTELESAAQLRSRIEHRKVAIKALLLDQSVLAGLGNIYADEVLWLARIRNTARPDQITGPGYVRLFDAIKVVLTRAVQSGGSTLRDAQYVDVFGNAGSAQTHHAVYAREGQPCLRCGTLIRRRVVAGRSSFYCPRCQR